MEELEFIKSVLEGAIISYRAYNVLPSLTIAQAALESGWGDSIEGNMLFGIKWTEGCGYAKQLLWTSEYINGKYTKVQDYFRKYASLADSICDHGNFLKVNSRYEKVLQCTNYIDACNEIQAAGYATDPDYAKQLIGIIEGYDLDLYDEEAQKMETTEMTKEEAKKIVQEKTGFTDGTIQYMADYYRYGDALIIKLATLLKGGN